MVYCEGVPHAAFSEQTCGCSIETEYFQELHGKFRQKIIKLIMNRIEKKKTWNMFTHV